MSLACSKLYKFNTVVAGNSKELQKTSRIQRQMSTEGNNKYSNENKLLTCSLYIEDYKVCVMMMVNLYRFVNTLLLLCSYVTDVTC